MSLRAQLTLFTALAVAAAVVIVSLAAYFATQNRLRAQVDNTLLTRSAGAADAGGLPRRGPDDGSRPEGARDPFADTDTFFQVINASGAIVAAPGNQQLRLPVDATDIAVANGTQATFKRDVTVDGTHLRMITNPGGSGEAVQTARSLEEVDASLRGLRRILFGVSGAGIVLAGGFGLVVASRSLRPVARLTAAAEHVASTQDLSAKIDVDRDDEVGRLALSFNAMLQALLESRQQQQQLVTDASHELRTPLTSLRTNIEVLAGSSDMPVAERRQILAAATSELDELTALVGELVELASERGVETQEFEDVRLDQLAAGVVERTARRSGLEIRLDARPALVVGSYHLLERAAGNLLDNAAKWSPPGVPIDVRVEGGQFEVRDHGPGIPDADRAHVFNRFYRADAARAQPGSGLGLAIVKQIVDAHGGRAWVEPAPGGGTIAAFELPSVALAMESQPAVTNAAAAPT